MNEISEVHEKLNGIGNRVTKLESQSESFYRRMDGQDGRMNSLQGKFEMHQKESMELHNKILGSLDTLKALAIAVGMLVSILAYLK